MTTNEQTETRRSRHAGSGGVMGGSYGLAFIGAAVYFVQHADSFGQGVLGIIKAIVWPAVLTYGLLGHLGM